MTTTSSSHGQHSGQLGAGATSRPDPPLGRNCPFPPSDVPTLCPQRSGGSSPASGSPKGGGPGRILTSLWGCVGVRPAPCLTQASRVTGGQGHPEGLLQKLRVGLQDPDSVLAPVPMGPVTLLSCSCCPQGRASTGSLPTAPSSLTAGG